MSKPHLDMTMPPSTIFYKETLVKGQPARVRCVQINGQTFSISRGPLAVVTLDDEWFNEVSDPAIVVEELRSRRVGDLLTFCQRLPNVEPKYSYYTELESIAALALDSYDAWWKRIDSATRNKIRKSQKLGIEVRECAFDDEFVAGMTAIFNETPLRQGRPFWHYGKDVHTVKQQFSRYLFREDLLGAYYQGQLVGFAMMGNNGVYSDLGQIISMVAHRDKATTNALIAKAVDVSIRRNLQHLVYAFWLDSSLGDFKRQSGFEEVKLPRYFVPLTAKGSLALKGNMHHGMRQFLPRSLEERLKRLRRVWWERGHQRSLARP